MENFMNKLKNPIFSDFLEQWVEEELKNSSRSENTFSTYLGIVKNIQTSSLGSLRLHSITTKHLQDFMDELSFGEKSYAKTTCNCYMSVLHNIFRFAIFPKQYISSDPMDFVINKKKKNDFSFISTQSHSYNTITSQQFLKITDYLKKRNSSSLLPIQISYYSGLRLGEVCGLTWDDINLEDRSLIVKRTLFYNSYRHRMEIGPTKNGKSRIVDFGLKLFSILKEAKEKQSSYEFFHSPHLYQNYYRKVFDLNRFHFDLYHFRNKETISHSMNPINFVCRLTNGSYLSPRTVQNMCISARRSITGIEQFHFHSLRHTYTSNLLDHGASPQDVQELLGHADVRTTMNIYAHSQRNSRKKSVLLLDEI